MMFTQLDYEDGTSMNDGESLKITEFTDLNGDRRDDVVRLYSGKQEIIGGQIHMFKACIDLNTGKGFKAAHNCYAEITGTVDAIVTQDYYGDCAL